LVWFGLVVNGPTASDVDDDDRALTAAARAGDIAAFEELVRLHGPALYRYARRMTRDADAVADIVQETFIAACRQIGNFRADSSVRTWLFGICARKVVVIDELVDWIAVVKISA